MRLVDRLLHAIFERRARKLSLDDLTQELHASAPTIASHIASAPNTSANRVQANHIIGLERWSVARLKSALGSPLVIDEYDSYRPGNDLSMTELSTAFTQARQDTLALAGQLKQAGAADKTVPHNDLGDLSVKAWLAYLSGHANRELNRIR